MRVLCGKCARLAPSTWLRRLRRLRRRMKRTTDQAQLDRIMDLHGIMWDRIRERAIQVKVGIT